MFHPATIILKNDVLINEGLSEIVQVYVFLIFLNFFRNFRSLFPEKGMRNMEKVNKYEQNDHNARTANRRERQTKPNLKTRRSRFARTVKARAKAPAVEMLTISNVPTDILDAIDELAARQDRSRSSFVRRELQRIVAGHWPKAA
jgi:hypothetical protein